MKHTIGNFLRYIPLYISYLIAPIMITLVTWASGLIENTLFTFSVVFVFSFITLYINVLYKFKKENQNKKNEPYIKDITYRVVLYFLLILSIGVLIDIISSRVLRHFNSVWNIKVILITFCSYSILLLLMNFSLNKWKWRKSLTFILFGIIITSALFYMIHDTQNINNIRTIAFLMLTIYSIFLFKKVTVMFVRPYDTLSYKKITPQKKHLIMFISLIDDKYIETSLDDWNCLEYKNRTLRDIALELQNSTKYNHSWEMNLRAIDHHLNKRNSNTGKLEQLTIIASSNKVNNIASMKQVKYFIKLLNKYQDANNEKFEIKLAVQQSGIVTLKKGTEVVTDSNWYNNYYGIDFLSIEETQDAIEQILNDKIDNNIAHFETVIDFTGGQKTTSVASTLIGTIYNVFNQYVDTNHDKNIILYNFKYKNPSDM